MAKNNFLKNIFEHNKEFKDILKRFFRKDFSGNTGLTLKNSTYQFLTNFVSKIGSLFLTIVLARILMPDLFGLYSLALTTILIFATISELKIGRAMVKYLSSLFSKNNNSKAKGYFLYIFKIKLAVAFGSIFLLISTSYFISNFYYNKPIFLALLAGALYILFSTFLGPLENILHAKNNFKKSLFKEIFFQLARLFFVPTFIIFFISSSNEILISSIILALSLSYFLTLIFYLAVSQKELSFLKHKQISPLPKEKKEVRSFIILLSLTTFSGLFFGYIDKIMLGGFVQSEFIGYYAAAFSLISAITSFIVFSLVLFPLFSRMKGEQLKRGMKKSTKVTLFLGSTLFVLTLIFAPLIIKIYPPEYTSSTILLRILAFLLISSPLIALYESYFLSQGKQKTIIKFVFLSTVINIFLNYVFIKSLLGYSQMYAVIGAAIATIISKIIYVVILAFKNQNIFSKTTSISF